MVIASRLPQIHTLDSLIRYPDYRLLWTGNFFANSAQWFQLLSIGWLVRDLSVGSASSAVQVVTVGGMVTLPMLLVTPWGGVLGDRLNRRKLIMTVSAGMGVLAAAFALMVELDLAQVSHAYLYVVLSGVGLAIVQPTRQALIANTVPRDAIGHAYATNTFTIAGTRMIGPFFGGIIIASMGFTWNFLVEAALYFGVVLALLPMKTPYLAQPRAAASPARRPSSRMSPLRDLAEGIRYVWKDEPAIFQIMLLSMVANVVIHPVLFMLPLFTADVLQQGADVGGYLLAASGFGALGLGHDHCHGGVRLPKGPAGAGFGGSGSGCNHHVRVHAVADDVDFPVRVVFRRAERQPDRQRHPGAASGAGPTAQPDHRVAELLHGIRGVHQPAYRLVCRDHIGDDGDCRRGRGGLVSQRHLLFPFGQDSQPGLKPSFPSAAWLTIP